MAMRSTHRLVIALAALALASAALAGDVTITVDASKQGPRLSPLQHGIFFEEINHAGDGGLYAELLRNRRFVDGLSGWTSVEVGGAKTAVAFDAASASDSPTPKIAGVRVEAASGGRGGIRNEGYWGIGVEKGAKYDCSFEVSTTTPALKSLRVALVSPEGQELAEQEVRGIGPVMRKMRCTLTPSRTEAKASLAITTDGPGLFFLNDVSLMPRQTFKERPNGLRSDLAQHVAAIKPSFVRFPGGCYVEGDKLADRFQWKNTLGDPGNRVPHWDLWGYRSSNGLGYHEYLQWCEDVGAEPLFVVNCGMSHTDFVPIPQMSAYVQDALDAIEYANGDVGTFWGSKRAANGHPKPFNLRLLEIGNENGWGNTLPAYEERYALFYDAIKKKYPEMTLIANVPVKSRPMDVVDEHYYSSPQFFVKQSHRYDGYPRTGPKVYVGEYAVTQGCGQGNLIAGLGEAFFITGMERNADVVRMASYAPLFVNVNDRKWNPDAIPFDSLRSFGTPSYWVQQMFSTNRGDVVIQSEVQGGEQTVTPRGAVGIGTWATAAEFADLKVTQNGKTLWTGDSKDHPLKAQRGAWSIANGTAKQTDLGTDRRAVGGDPSWTDYTFSLRARKLSGNEGFLILFHVQNESSWFWWNIGGWGNTRHNLQSPLAGGDRDLLTTDVPGKIETGRWYDIRVETEGNRIRCYLDNQLVHDVTVNTSAPTVGMVATREEKSGDLLLKVVNIGSEPQEGRIAIQGVPNLASNGSVLTLTSASPTDENSFENPKKVAPISRSLSGVGPQFSYRFPPYSVSILRLKAKGQSALR